jgi:hypothetical protein
VVYHFNGGWLRPAIAREGRRQKAIRRALAGYGPLTTAELLAFAYPRLKTIDRRHYWYAVRRACEKVAERCEPRRKPLLWRAKPDLDRG